IYYERYQFADVFAQVKRAPKKLIDQIVEIPGVATVDARITRLALVDIPDSREPVTAQTAVHPGNECAEPGACNAPNDRTGRDENDREFHVVRGNCEVPVAQGLEQSNLLAFQRDHPIEPLIEKECRDEQKYRRQRAANISEHVEPVLAPRV